MMRIKPDILTLEYPAERLNRGIAIIRKNCLFAGSEAGGQRLAILYSFAATCKANGICFRKWLEDVLLRPLHYSYQSDWLLTSYQLEICQHLIFWRSVGGILNSGVPMYLLGRLLWHSNVGVVLQHDMSGIRHHLLHRTALLNKWLRDRALTYRRKCV